MATTTTKRPSSKAKGAVGKKSKKELKGMKNKGTDAKVIAKTPAKRVSPTMPHLIGEIFWLLSQSPRHKHLAISDSEWFFLPALASRQARIFHAEDKPIGLAMWASVSEEVEAEKFLQKGAKLRPDEWTSGDRKWLVELVCPFASAENKLAETMLSELVKTAMKGKTLKIRRTDQKTGKSEVVELKG